MNAFKYIYCSIFKFQQRQWKGNNLYGAKFSGVFVLTLFVYLPAMPLLDLIAIALRIDKRNEVSMRPVIILFLSVIYVIIYYFLFRQSGHDKIIDEFEKLDQKAKNDCNFYVFLYIFLDLFAIVAGNLLEKRLM